MRSIFEEAKLVDPVFVKMDIESHEYRILDGLVAHSPRISGLVIEFRADGL